MIASIDGRRDRWRPVTTAVAPILSRVAKHLALLACLAIVSAINEPVPVGQLTIFALVVAAAVVHCAGRALASSELRLARRSRHGP